MELIAKTLCAITLATCAFGAMAQELDNPLPPVDPKAELSTDFKQVTLTWGFPGEVGEDGGYVDPAKITYYIFDAFGSYFDPPIAVTTQTHYTFDYSDVDGQDFVAYQLTAGMDECWYSLPVNSNIVCVGAPMEAPFNESFCEKKQTYPWLQNPEYGYDVTIKVNADGVDGFDSQDADGGYLFVKSKEKSQWGIISIKVDISQLTEPIAQFYCQGTASLIELMASADGGEFSSIAQIDPSAADEEAVGGWKLCQTNLDAYKDSEFVQIQLVCDFSKQGETAIIDNISIVEGFKEDAIYDIEAIDAPAAYYTIDGIQVPAHAMSPGIYIRLQNGHAEKIVKRR